MPYKHVRIAGTRAGRSDRRWASSPPLMSAYLDQSETWETLRPWREHPYLDALAAQARGGAASGMGNSKGLAEAWTCRWPTRSCGTVAATCCTRPPTAAPRRP